MTFSLPNIVQCTSAAAEEAIRALDVGRRRIERSEQLKFKYLISLDGNGATCSRVAIALRSNSVLLKYASPHQLFYFQDMLPWVHYVPIDRDSDVERIIEDGTRRPERYRRIARNGGRFFLQHLQRSHCELYVAALLKQYASLVSTVG